MPFLNDTYISNYLPATIVDHKKAVGHKGSFVFMLAPTQTENEVRLLIHSYDTEYKEDKPTNDIGTASIKMTQETAATLFYQMNEVFNFCDELNIPDSLVEKIEKLDNEFPPMKLVGMKVI